MQSYLDDPRNFPSRFEYPTTIGGAAEMCQWQATLCDLSDLPQDEYMKPMTVIIAGTQSGEVVTYYTLKYYVDGIVKMAVRLEEGDTIQSFTGSTAKEGYTFDGWVDANGVEYTGTTMPEGNLNLYAKYTEIESNDILYYGAVLNGNITAVSALTSAQTSVFKDGEVISIFVPKDEFYAGKQDDEEWINESEETYRAEHKYPVYLLITQETSNNYSITAIEGPSSVTFVKKGTMAINGVTYDKYEYGTDNMCASVVDQTWTFTITLVRK